MKKQNDRPFIKWKICLVSELLLFAFILSGFAFLFCGNFFFAIGVFLVYLSAFFLLVYPLVNGYKKEKEKERQIALFLRNFYYRLPSPLFTAFFESIALIDDPSFASLSNSLSSLPFSKQARYFEECFNSPYYSIFLEIIDECEKDERQCACLMEPLIVTIEEKERYSVLEEKEKKKRLRSFLILWGVSLFLILFLRIGLKKIFSSEPLFYFWLFLSSFYFGILLFSTILFTLCFYRVRWRKEKNT